jgi:hypothetical protein
LGMPLHFRHLRKVHLQPPIDKIAAKMPGWVGKTSRDREELPLPRPF